MKKILFLFLGITFSLAPLSVWAVTESTYGYWRPTGYTNGSTYHNPSTTTNMFLEIQILDANTTGLPQYTTLDYGSTTSLIDGESLCTNSAQNQYCSVSAVIPPLNYFKIMVPFMNSIAFQYGYIQDIASTSSSTVTTVDNPNLDLFIVVLLFWIVFATLIFYFRTPSYLIR